MKFGPNLRRQLITLVITVLALVTGQVSRAVMIDFTWTGGGGSDHWFNPGNWADATVPASVTDGPAIFGNGRPSHVYISNNDFYASGLIFSGNDQPYFLDGDFDGFSSLATLHLGVGGIAYSPAKPVKSDLRIRVQLTSNQTWNIASGTLVLEGGINDRVTSDPDTFGEYAIAKTGAGTLVLTETDNSNWRGSVTLAGGQVVIGSSFGTSTALGSGTITFNGGTLIADDLNGSGSDARLSNDVVSYGLISTIGKGISLHLGYHGEGYSTITLNSSTVVTNNGQPLFLEGNILESGGGDPKSLTATGAGAAILTGFNSYTGGTFATNGTLIFAEAHAIPSVNLASSSVGHLTAGVNGYIGFADSSYTNSVQSYFINDFDKTKTSGTIGFDSDPDSGTNTFTDDINLTGFHADARLGSATTAILSGMITPQGIDYRFGGGGGLLQVDSHFVDVGGNSAIVVDSPAEAPLTLRITANPEVNESAETISNSFSGGIYVTQSAVVFATGALPTQIETNNWALGTGGYIGYEGINADGVSDTSTQWGRMNDFIARFNPANPSGIIGLDGVPGYDPSRNIAGPANLGAFTGAIYLGTATLGYQSEGFRPGVRYSGIITTTNGGADPYRFAGYKGGALEVASTLSGSAGVIIGDPLVPATFGDFHAKEYSTVILSGDNSFLTGNVTFYGGQLMVGQNNGDIGSTPTTALGTGTLVVQPFPLPSSLALTGDDEPTAQLAAYHASGLIIPNHIVLNSDLRIAGEDPIKLTGVISGTGELYIDQPNFFNSVTLSGANDFSGGIYVERGSTLRLAGDTSAGAGALHFGLSGGSAIFESQNPLLNGLFSDADAEVQLSNSNSARLTVNQATDSVYIGSLRADSGTVDTELSIYHQGVVVKTGAGRLRLENGTFYGYGQGTDRVGLEIQQGTLTLANFSFESSQVAVKINGGSFTVEGMTFTNPIVFGASGGKLAGNYTFNTLQTFGTGIVLSPGNSPGVMTFAAGYSPTNGVGTVFEFRAPTGTPGTDWDLINVTGALDLTSISTSGYVLQVVSLDGANTQGAPIAGLSGPASWTIFQATTLTGFTGSSQFAIDSSMFAGGGIFSVTQSGNNLVLNFTPVPEPSTYALLALGLGGVGLAAWRRRVRA